MVEGYNRATPPTVEHAREHVRLFQAIFALEPPFKHRLECIFGVLKAILHSSVFTGIPIGEPTISGEILSYDNCSNIVSRSNYNGLLLSMGGETYYYNGHQLEQKVKTTGGFSPSITTYLYDHDNRGRMISDGSANTQITYNHMNLPAKVSVNNVSLANYSYLADGTKICSMNDQGEGLVYCGPMVYRRNSTGALSFEGVSICSGRITSAGVRYIVTDHLGSVRGVILGSDGTLLECNNYALYGGVSSGPLFVTTNTESCRYHFSGKEDQSIDFSVPYTDFGARHYSPALRRWLIPDPKSEDYYEISPYAYCAGDPVNLVDDDGQEIGDWQTGLFIIKHPQKAWHIGYVKKGSNNISSVAARFATTDDILINTQPSTNGIRIDEGTEVGAFRHALWQAMIISEYDYNTAKQIGDAHENNPYVNNNQNVFSSLSEADQTADLLNNIIGRNIGGINKSTDSRGLAIMVLNEFHEKGLYTAQQNEAGEWIVKRTKVSDDQFNSLMEVFLHLDNNGRK